MIDPNHKAAAVPGAIGTAVTAFLHEIGEYDWSHIAGFLTCVLVTLQIIGWVIDRVKKWRSKT